MRDKGFKYRLAFGLFVFAMIMVFTQTVSCYADWTPTDFNTWKQGNEYVTDVGRLPRNYEDSTGSWEIIDTTWESVGDTLFTCRKAVVTADAWPDGVSEFTVARNNDTIKIKQVLDRLILYDTLTGDRYDLITDLPLSNFVREGRELRWSFPGGNYRLRKGFGRTAAQVVFKKALLDSVCKIYDKLPLDSITTMIDSLADWDEEGDTAIIVQVPVITTLPERVSLGTVFRYEITGVSDSLLAKLTSHRGTRKKLFQFGRRHLSITSHRLHFVGEENVKRIPILQEWRKHPSKSKTFYLCEYLMMWQLDSLHTVWPNKSVWHGATESVQDFSLEDTYITQPENFLYNYGGSYDVYAGGPVAAGNDTIALLRPSGDIGGTIGAGATIESCSLNIYINLLDDGGVLNCHRLFKYFIEGNENGDRPDPDSGATWNMFQAIAFRIGLAGFNWAQDDGTPEGPNCADDNGVDNVIDNSTCVAARADREATAMSQVNVQASQYYAWEITTALAQDWYDGDAVVNGVMLSGSAVSARFTSSEVTGDINGFPPLPYFRFRYTIAGGQVMLW